MPSLFEIQSMKDSETAFFKYTLRSQSMQNNALFFLSCRLPFDMFKWREQKKSELVSIRIDWKSNIYIMVEQKEIHEFTTFCSNQLFNISISALTVKSFSKYSIRFASLSIMCLHLTKVKLIEARLCMFFASLKMKAIFKQSVLPDNSTVPPSSVNTIILSWGRQIYACFSSNNIISFVSANCWYFVNSI